MFLSRAALSLNAISRVPGALQIPQSAGVAVQLLCSARSSPWSPGAAATPQPPPGPAAPCAGQPLTPSWRRSWCPGSWGSRVLPPAAEPVLGGEEGEGAAAVTPLSCKNVLEIRRRKMNRHKYKKLMKRTTFLRRKVMEGRRKRKQIRFERDLKRIWTRAGLKSAPEGWSAPKIYVRQYQSKKD
ncbi:hypothetical protein ANANG_G00229170 [Anguilla anguilla]|uniref:Small ribosomal subunit protein mS38 n=1 Tax=Anguilla anguilla TaxID=7936 RepID=A0A9D3LXM9_ANGAN|nr:hypothetical protein ANANG_G00229170 [Anguilla anguilla]